VLFRSVMLYIANQIDTNIRELEGALIRVVAYSSLVNQDIDAALAADALKDIIPSNKPKEITIETIQEFVGEKYNVKVDEILAKKRTKAIVLPRQIAMYLSRELTDSSLPSIGKDESVSSLDKYIAICLGRTIALVLFFAKISSTLTLYFSPTNS